MICGRGRSKVEHSAGRAPTARVYSSRNSWTTAAVSSRYLPRSRFISANHYAPTEPNRTDENLTFSWTAPSTILVHVPTVHQWGPPHGGCRQPVLDSLCHPPARSLGGKPAQPCRTRRRNLKNFLARGRHKPKVGTNEHACKPNRTHTFSWTMGFKLTHL